LNNLQSLEEKVLANGWTFSREDFDRNDPWLGKVWLLSSVWSPHGMQLHLGFLFDPDDWNTPNKDHIWCIGIWRKFPRLQGAEWDVRTSTN
jgi:hypothetical protein